MTTTQTLRPVGMTDEQTHSAVTTTARATIEILADAAYHAEQLLYALQQIDPESAHHFTDREHHATAKALADALRDISEHPAVDFLP